MNAKYDTSSEYHPGDEVEADARAHLGVYKTLDQVPPRHHLENYETEFEGQCVWAKFFEKFGGGWSYNTRQYQYGKVARDWTAFCEERGRHPALATPRMVEDYLSREESEMSTRKSLHDLRFRPLYRLYKWMLYSSEYPHRYSPVVMAVLFGGSTWRCWWTRVNNRRNP